MMNDKEVTSTFVQLFNVKYRKEGKINRSLDDSEKGNLIV